MELELSCATHLQRERLFIIKRTRVRNVYLAWRRGRVSDRSAVVLPNLFIYTLYALLRAMAVVDA